MDFPQIVKQLRQARGWSQQEVADRVGLNKMTISQYENGKRKPSFEMIEAFRHAGPETQAAIRAILHLEGRSSRNGIRAPGKPFVYGKYYILIVPFSHTA